MVSIQSQRVSQARLVKNWTKYALLGGSAMLLWGCAGMNAPKPETAQVSSAPRTPAARTFTSFTPALRCMDDLMLAYGKKDIVITTAGIPDSTGKVMTGTKEMLISAVSRMTVKSKALSFIDYDTERNDLLALFQDIAAAGAGADRKLPNYYIRGAITQLDENALDFQKSAGVSMLSLLELGISKDQTVSLVSMDLNMGDSVTRMIIPGVSASNTMAITRAGSGTEAGGKISKVGLSFNVSLNRSEGLGSSVRALVELGLIEVIGKLTNVPYWKCLQIEKTNPSMMEQAREWYDGMSASDRVRFIQRKLQAIGSYKGEINGAMNDELRTAVAKYQSENNLIANGRVDFEVYYALLDSEEELPPDNVPSKTVKAPAPQDNARGALAVKLDTDRGAKPVYKAHEMLRAKVLMSRDGVLYCYYRDNNGVIARIYPNRFSPDPFVRANQTLGLPPENSPFQIRFDQANAREQVVCFGSDRDIALPTALKGADLTPLKVGSMDEISAAFKKSNPNVAESKLEISVQ